jgi:predicted GNAT family acetyltransferase
MIPNLALKLITIIIKVGTLLNGYYIQGHTFSCITYLIQDKTCIIKRFCIDSDLRGKGFGKALLLHCLREADEKKCTQIVTKIRVIFMLELG